MNSRRSNVNNAIHVNHIINGIFCNLGDGDVDFPKVRQILLDHGFTGWCTVEQDCDPTLDVSPIDDARANREYLESIGFN